MTPRRLALIGGVFLVMAALPSRTHAQLPDGVIQGTVQSESGQILPSAVVAVRLEGDTAVVASTLTSREGRFILEGLTPGAYRLSVQLLGYEPITDTEVTLSAASGRTDVGVVQLQSSAIVLQGVEVTGQRAPLVVLTDRNVYSTADLPIADGGVATDVLRSVPELDVDVDGKVTTRGTTPRIHIDGRPAPMQGDALTRYLEQLPGDRIERIEVIPNPSARYEAEGSGGIVNIVLKRGVDLGVSGTLSIFGDTKGATGLNGRINYQVGSLAIFAGVGGRMSKDEQTSSSLLENRLNDPSTFLRRDGVTEFDNSFGSGDLAIEYKVTPRGTAWAQARHSLSEYDNNGVLAHHFLDASLTPLDRYDRVDDSRRDGGNGSTSIGYRHITQAQRDEWSIEVRRNGNDSDVLSETITYPLDDLGELSAIPRETLWGLNTDAQTDLSIQGDLARPWGSQGRIEVGYRRSIRDIDNGRLYERAFGSDPDPEVLRNGEFRHREAVDAGYLTLDRPVGRLNVQAGMRVERVANRATLPLESESFETSYADFFPNLNVSTELGEGRQLRLSYARRLNRPPPYVLDPTDRSADPLTRYVGNPYLSPAYTQSLTADATWTSTIGTLRFSPYYRSSVDNWEQLSTLDEGDVTTSTWFNVASLRTVGSSASASLRQLGPLSGSLNLNGYREEREASRGAIDYSGSSFRISGGSNLSLRLRPSLSFGLSANYNPARDTPQGSISGILFTNVSLRQQFLDRRASISLSVMDPLAIAEFNVVTRDPTLSQTVTGRPSFRRANLSLSYSFGRPPQSARRQTGPIEEPAPVPGPGVGQ